MSVTSINILEPGTIVRVNGQVLGVVESWEASGGVDLVPIEIMKELKQLEQHKKYRFISRRL